MNAYAKYFDKNSKYINLLFNDKEILEKYNKIWNNIKYLLKKEFNIESVCSYKYIKTKKITMIECIKIFNIQNK